MATERRKVELITNENGVNRLGLKGIDDQTPDALFKSSRSPWISEATKRMKHKRKAYLALEKSYHQALNKNSQEARALKQALIVLSAGKVPSLPEDHPNQDVVNRLVEQLEGENALEFAQFAKTLTDAQPYGIVRKGWKSDNRNEHLAELISLFTYIYEEKPQNNPLLYGFPQMTAERMLLNLVIVDDGFVADYNDRDTQGEAVECYMKKISDEIQRIIDMSPQDLGMTFSDDNVKHVAIVRKLKLAFNRLSAQLGYGWRFSNLPAGQYDLEVVEDFPKDSDIAPGKIYLVNNDQEVYCLRDKEGNLKFASFAGIEYCRDEVDGQVKTVAQVKEEAQQRKEAQKKAQKKKERQAELGVELELLVSVSVLGPAASKAKPEESAFKKIESISFAELVRAPDDVLLDDVLLKAKFLAELAERGHTSTNLLAREYDLVVADNGFLSDPKKNAIPGKIYLQENGQYYVRDPRGNLKEGDLSEDGLDCTDLQNKLSNPIFKEAILSITSVKGHTYAGEKTNQYQLEKCRPGTECEHEILQSKISMRRKKRGALWLARVFALLITLGQVAIAVFTATGIFAIAIGLSCGITNVFLFARDIFGVMLSWVKGEPTKGLPIWRKLLSWVKGDFTRGLHPVLKVVLGFWAIFSLATALVAGGLVMVSLVALFGFAIQTAPVWLAIGAGIIATLTVIGMASLFLQVGAGMMKSLRGQSLKTLIKGSWESFKSFLKWPKLNKEVADLQDQVEAYKTELAKLKEQGKFGGFTWKRNSEAVAQIQALRAEFYPIRGHLRREIAAHRLRHIAKLLFTLVFVPTALLAAVVATYAFSVISATGTADTMKLVFGWNDKVCTTVSNVLTWGFAALMNGALSAKNLFNVGVALAGSVSKVTIGLVVGVATVCNLAYHGMLWQAIKKGCGAFRLNPLKSFIPALRAGLALAFGAAIALNGYGNGSTAGGGAIRDTYIPNWVLSLVSPETFTVVLSSASSMALCKGAIDDAYRSDTPMMNLKNPAPDPAVKKRKLAPEFVAFFDSSVRPDKRRFDVVNARSRDEGILPADYDYFSSDSSASSDGEAVPSGFIL